MKPKSEQNNNNQSAINPGWRAQRKRQLKLGLLLFFGMILVGVAAGILIQSG